MAAASSWQGHLPASGGMMALTGPASGGVMALPGPATLRKTIKVEVSTSVRQVLSSHTHTRPADLGGPVCGPLAMLLKVWGNKSACGCSLELHSSFTTGDGLPTGMVRVEAMPNKKQQSKLCVWRHWLRCCCGTRTKHTCPQVTSDMGVNPSNGSAQRHSPRKCS